MSSRRQAEGMSLLFSSENDGLDMELNVQEQFDGYVITAPNFSSPIRLRRTSLNEAPLLLELTKRQMDSVLKEAWKGGFDWDDWYRDLKRAIISQEASVYQIYVMRSNFFAGYLWYIEEKDSIWLTSIMIDEHWQGKNLGKILMAFLIYLARIRDKRFVRLGVQRNNTRALHFYLKLGFIAIDFVKYANTLILEKEVLPFYQNHGPLSW